MPIVVGQAFSLDGKKDKDKDRSPGGYGMGVGISSTGIGMSGKGALGRFDNKSVTSFGRR